MNGWQKFLTFKIIQFQFLILKIFSNFSFYLELADLYTPLTLFWPTEIIKKICCKIIIIKGCPKKIKKKKSIDTVIIYWTAWAVNKIVKTII